MYDRFYSSDIGFQSRLYAGPALAKDIKVLRIGIGIDPDTINPIEITTAIPANITELLYGTLFKTNAKGKVIPNMASEWSVSEDGLDLDDQAAQRY